MPGTRHVAGARILQPEQQLRGDTHADRLAVRMVGSIPARAGNEELVFSDHEGTRKKTEYSPLGGCYYSCKMAVLEALAQEQKQAGAIILREALHGYVPLGVFNVRENVRSAMRQPAQEFEDIRSALSHISEKFTLPMQRFIEEGNLLRNTLRERQCTFRDFAVPPYDHNRIAGM